MFCSFMALIVEIFAPLKRSYSLRRSKPVPARPPASVSKKGPKKEIFTSRFTLVPKVSRYFFPFLVSTEMAGRVLIPFVLCIQRRAYRI